MDEQQQSKQAAVPLWALPSCSETGEWTAVPLLELPACSDSCSSSRWSWG